VADRRASLSIRQAERMDRRLDPVPVVATFAAAVRPVADVVGLYVGGSLAAGDYQPDVSDLDVVAIVGSRLDGQQLEHLRALHVATSRADPAAMKLHCAYVPLAAARDLATPHSYWATATFINARSAALPGLRCSMEGSPCSAQRRWSYCRVSIARRCNGRPGQS